MVTVVATRVSRERAFSVIRTISQPFSTRHGHSNGILISFVGEEDKSKGELDLVFGTAGRTGVVERRALLLILRQNIKCHCQARGGSAMGEDACTALAPSATGRQLGARLGGKTTSPGLSCMWVMGFGPTSGLRPLVSELVKTEMQL